MRFLWVVLISVVAGGCSIKRAAPAYETPELTFETWKRAAENLDLDVLVSCYVRESQDGLRQELSASSMAQLKDIQAETKRTKFEIEKVLYEGPKAYLRVRRTKGRDTDVEVVHMILEKSSWKLLP